MSSALPNPAKPEAPAAPWLKHTAAPPTHTHASTGTHTHTRTHRHTHLVNLIPATSQSPHPPDYHNMIVI